MKRLKQRVSRVKLIPGLMVAALLLLSAKQAYALSNAEVQQVMRLTDYTREQKELGNPAYLEAALGKQGFYDVVAKLQVSVAGLSSQSEYIREAAAGIILQYAEERHLADLATALDSESERAPAVRKAIYLSLMQLRYKYAGDKKQFILNLLNQYAAGQTQEIVAHRELFEFLLTQAQDNCLQEAAELIVDAQAKVFPQDSELKAQAEQAKQAITFAAPYVKDGKVDKEALVEAALKSGQPLLQQWAVKLLTQQPSLENQRYLNSLLLKFFNADTPQLRNKTYVLLDALREAGIMRSENRNPCLEPEQGRDEPVKGALRPGVESLPSGWSLTRKDDPATQLIYPATKQKPLSFGNCLSVVNASGETILANEKLVFSDKLPLSLEFGLSYIMGYPEDGWISQDKDGALYLEDEDFKPIEKLDTSQLKLIAHLEFERGAQAKDIEVSAQPYEFYNWKELKASYVCEDKTNPIKSVELKVVLKDKTNSLTVYLDDIYCRRQETDFYSTPPKVKALILPNYPVLTEEAVELTAQMLQPQDKAVTGVWVSSLDGDLLPEVSGMGKLTAQVKLKTPGEHNIFFAADNDFALRTTAVADNKLTVIKPQLKLTSANNLQPAPRVLILSITPTGLENSGIKYTLAPPALFADNGSGKPLSLLLWSTGRGDYLIDTSALRSGYYTLQAAASLTLNRSGRSSTAGPFYSDKLVIYVENTTLPEAVILAGRRSGQSPLTVQFYGNYSKGNISYYQWSFGDGKTSREANPKHTFVNPSYKKPVTYIVKLTVTDTRGNKHTSQITVSVQPKPLAAA